MPILETDKQKTLTISKRFSFIVELEREVQELKNKFDLTKPNLVASTLCGEVLVISWILLRTHVRSFKDMLTFGVALRKASDA